MFDCSKYKYVAQEVFLRTQPAERWQGELLQARNHDAKRSKKRVLYIESIQQSRERSKKSRSSFALFLASIPLWLGEKFLWNLI